MLFFISAVYLTIILMISALSVIFTIVVLDIYFNHDEEEAVPEWAQKFTRSFLVPITCWKGNCPTCCSGEQVSPAVDDDKSKSMTRLNATSSKPSSPRKGRNKSESNGGMSYPDDKYRDSLSGVLSEQKFKWKEIALILDRFFMYIFIFLVVSVSIICISLLISAYSSY